MVNKKDEGSEVLGSLTARIEETVLSDEANFDSWQAFALVEEAVGGSEASAQGLAPMRNFNVTELSQLSVLVERLNAQPPEFKDEDDLRIYTKLTEDARLFIDERFEQFDEDERAGGHAFRVAKQQADARRLQEELFVEARGHSLNAAADLDKKKKRA